MRLLALVLEEEPEIATFACAVFMRYGIDTVIAESAADAIELLTTINNISIVLINVTNGRDPIDVVKVIATRWPSIRLILMSSRLESLHELPPVVFLAKPTTSMALITMIGRVSAANTSDPNSPPSTDFGGFLQ